MALQQHDIFKMARSIDPDNYECVAQELEKFNKFSKLEIDVAEELFRQTKKRGRIQPYSEYEVFRDTTTGHSRYGMRFRNLYYDGNLALVLTKKKVEVALVSLEAKANSISIVQLQGVKGRQKDLEGLKWQQALFQITEDYARLLGANRVEFYSFENNSWPGVKKDSVKISEKLEYLTKSQITFTDDFRIVVDEIDMNELNSAKLKVSATHPKSKDDFRIKMITVREGDDYSLDLFGSSLHINPAFRANGFVRYDINAKKRGYILDSTSGIWIKDINSQLSSV